MNRPPSPGPPGRSNEDLATAAGLSPVDGHGIREALVRQWQAVAAAIPALDLDRPSRVAGWRNREVLAHLYIQPVLVSRFLTSASAADSQMTAAANLSGTGALRDLIDASAREGAARGNVDLAVPMARAMPALAAADLRATITSWQGTITLVDYLVTRCVEAVVHGGDLVEPVAPDETARTITASVLREVLAAKAPHLVHLASQLSETEWIAAATGRMVVSGDLARVLPIMT